MARFVDCSHDRLRASKSREICVLTNYNNVYKRYIYDMIDKLLR